MKKVFKIFLPKKLVKKVDEMVEEEGFATRSDFFFDLIQKKLEGKILKELAESRRELLQGEGKALNSFENLE